MIISCFIIAQLSSEDLSLCRTAEGRTCFPGIQQIPSKLYLAAVAEPLTVLQELAGAEQTDDIVITSNGVLSKPIQGKAGQFVFVDLKNDVPNETKDVTFSRHDSIITKLATELSKKHKNLLIIFTGRKSSAADHRRVARQAAAAPVSDVSAAAPVSDVAAAVNTTSAPAAAIVPVVEATTHSAPTHAKQVEADDTIPEFETFFNRSRLLLYYHELKFTNISIEIEDINIIEVSPTQLTVELNPIASQIEYKLTLNITGDGGYWQVDGIEFRNTIIVPRHTSIAALDNFSFHCSPIIAFYNATNGESIDDLQWSGLQLQPFFGALEPSDGPYGFGEAWDCVGFTSAGIWGGLFVTLLMLLILSIGISWMMEIRTMDRFDDPKGKTITINTNE